MCRNETIGTRQFIIFSEVFTGLPAEHAKVVQVSELKDFGDLPSCVDIIVLKQVSMLEKIFLPIRNSTLQLIFLRPNSRQYFV